MIINKKLCKIILFTTIFESSFGMDIEKNKKTLEIIQNSEEFNKNDSENGYFTPKKNNIKSIDFNILLAPKKIKNNDHEKQNNTLKLSCQKFLF